jgi:hypothetical protein
MTQEANAKELSQDRGFSGIAKKDNLADWAARARDNSYRPNKAQARHDVGTEGANKDYAAGDVKDWKQPQRMAEGCGYAPMDAVTAKNTYTGKDGSKRD